MDTTPRPIDTAAAPSRRVLLGGMSAVALAASLGRHAPADAAPGATEDTTKVLRSDRLEVTVGTDFPRIVSYRERSGNAVLHGATDPVDHILINGTKVSPKVTLEASSSRAMYRLTTPVGSRIDAEITVDGWGVEWRITDIREGGDERIGTLQIPQLRMIALRSDQPGAQLRCGRIELDQAVEGDVVVKPAADADPESTARGGAYGVVATDELGAALETNVVYDVPSSEDKTTWENGRLWHQLRRRGEHTETGFTPGQWTIRPERSTEEQMEPLPWVRVILTQDRNDDGAVDWQDAAIALRDIAVVPRGGDEQHLRAVAHIPFNFGSQATNPFLHTLDQVKRINLATDGLRQFTLLKGYQSEGHDSAHPDYAGNYNTGAGGLEAMNTLLDKGSRWDSDFAVHVNATESYPEANAFSETLVDTEDRQWDWLNQSYRIDARRDLVSGDIAQRFADLRKEAHPGLNMLYLDVFRESGWNSDGLQRILAEQGWLITTEWGHGLERSALWSHWASETTYGPDSSRGINSTLIRMVRHHQKDVFSDRYPTVLPTAQIGNFEGWQGKDDWNVFYEMIWTHQLPAKFLQAFPIKTLAKDEVTFFAPQAAVTSRSESETQVIEVDGVEVLRGRAYLLPWEPRDLTKPTKLYHFNQKGGRTTWTLPSGWRSSKRVHVYRLTDQGRERVGSLPVRSGKVTLEAEAGQPYVLYRKPVPAQKDPRWGEGSPLRDPLFLSGELKDWKVRGKASVERNGRGQYELHLPKGPKTVVSQRLGRLEPGHHVLGVHVEVGAKAGQSRRTEVAVRVGKDVSSRWLERSTAQNYVQADVKHDTRMQRVLVPFTVTRRQDRVTVELSAEAGSARVAFDGVRVDRAEQATTRDGAVAFEDFEHVPYGWGPFVKGDAGGNTDPRTHVAMRNEPYTQRGWNGKVIDDVLAGERSLKSRGENLGLVYRTVPHTVRFEPGRRYEVRFDFQCDTAKEYEWLTAVDRPEAKVLEWKAIPKVTKTTTMKVEVEAPAEGDVWVGLRKLTKGGSAEFVLDNFEVRERDD